MTRAILAEIFIHLQKDERLGDCVIVHKIWNVRIGLWVYFCLYFIWFFCIYFFVLSQTCHSSKLLTKISFKQKAGKFGKTTKRENNTERHHLRTAQKMVYI